MNSIFTLRNSVILSVIFAFQFMLIGNSAVLGLSDKPIMRLGKINLIGNVTFSADGKYVAAGISRGALLLDGRTLNFIKLFEVYTASARCVAFSPDGKMLAGGLEGGLENNTIKLWDVGTEDEIATLKGHTDRIESVAFSPDGKILASGSDDGTIRLWDIATAKEIGQIEHPSNVNSVAFSPDGKILAAGCMAIVILWDMSKWDMKDIQTIKQIKPEPSLRHDLSVYAVAFSPDGKILASGSDDHAVKLWDTGTWKEIHTLINEDTVWSVSFNPDGKILAVGIMSNWDRHAKLWNVQTGEEIKLKEGIYSIEVAFSPRLAPSGSILAFLSREGLTLMDVNTEEQIARFEEQREEITSVAISHDGNILALGTAWGQSKINLRDMKTGKKIKTLIGHEYDVTLMAFSPDDSILASASYLIDKNIRLWNVREGKEIATLPGDYYSLAFSPDGKILAAGAKGGIVIWDVKTAKQLSIIKDKATVYSVAFSPDGKILASGTSDIFSENIKLWDVQTGNKIAGLKGHDFGVASVAFSPDGLVLASGSMDKTVKLWDLKTMNEIVVLFGHKHWVSSVTFSPDGQFLASGSRDSTVKLWDVPSGKEIITFRGHTDRVLSVAFGPDGKFLVSGSIDNRVLVWDTSVPSRHNMAPVLADGSVIPQEGDQYTEFTFKVTYTDMDDDMPFSITAKIDDDAPKPMVPVDMKDIDYTDGREYQYKTRLAKGKHKYVFTARDWMEDAGGDTSVHSGPDIVDTAVSPGRPPVRKQVVYEFTAAVKVSGEYGDCTSPVLALDKNGNVHIAYMGTFIMDGKAMTDVFYANNVGGKFGESIRIETPTDSFSRALSIVVDNLGTVHIAYIRSDNFNTSLQTDDIYYVNNAGGAFGKPVIVIENVLASNPVMVVAMAVDSSGKVHITCDLAGGIYYTNNMNGNFSKPIQIAPEGEAAKLKFDQNGNLHIVYSGKLPDFLFDSEIYYINNMGGGFSSPINISNDPIVSDSNPLIDIDRDGNIHITYEIPYEDTWGVCYVNNVSGDFGSPALVPIQNHHSMDVDDNGNVHIASAVKGRWSFYYATNVNGNFQVVEPAIVRNALEELIAPLTHEWLAVDSSGMPHFTFFYFQVTPTSPAIPCITGVYYVAGKEAIPIPDVTFTDAAKEAGIANLDVQTGASFVDYNNDGNPDIYVTNDGLNRLYHNNQNDTFTDVAVEAGIAGSIDSPFMRHSYCAAWGDYDNDGNTDLFLGRWSSLGTDNIFHNNGDGTFTINDSFHYLDYTDAHVASWVDYNNDGLLDLYANGLFRNDGNGNFTDVTKAAGLSDSGEKSAVWGDYDNNNDMDLCLWTRGEVKLYRNNADGTFTNVAEQAHLKYKLEDAIIRWVDYDNDGWMDLFFIDRLSIFLYHNNRDGTFTDIVDKAREGSIPCMDYFDAAAEGRLIRGNILNCSDFIWGKNATFLDFDNDGDQDLLLESSQTVYNDKLYLNNNGIFISLSGFMQEIPVFLPMPEAVSEPTAMIVSDYDLDGDLDVYLASERGKWGGMNNALYRNDNFTMNNWLRIKTVGVKSNRSGIGARVKVVTGPKLQIREVSGGYGISQDDMTLHFGLGTYAQADTVEIRWPSGIVQTLKNVRANQSLTVTEEIPCVKGDVNNNGKVESDDAILALRFAAKLDTPTPLQMCAADMNSDSKIGANDAILILRKSAGLASPGKVSVVQKLVKINIVPAEAYGKAGETTTISVKVDNIETLAGGQLIIGYDTSVLRAVDVSSSDSNIILTSNLSEPGIIRIAFVCIAEIKSKAITNIQFKVLSDDTSSIQFKEAELYGFDAQALIVSITNGKFRSYLAHPEYSGLLQNYPNPFNPDTWIPYQLKEDTNVRIVIYNMSGQLVRSINLGRKSAGFYTSKDRAAYWDGKNESGEAVASGLYFYSIQAGEFTDTKKMVIMQ